MEHLKLFEDYKPKIGLICNTFSEHDIDVLIPKKNGDGYLKAPFGGHHCNDNSKKFGDLEPSYVQEICDLDGFLSLTIYRDKWFGNEDKYTEEIKNILLKIFPYVTDFKVIDRTEFYNIIINR